MKASELKKALELVRPGLANKEILEQATSFVFRNGKIYSFNDQVAVIAPFESGFEGVISSDLYEFVSKLKPDAEIQIEEKENELRLVSGRNRAGVLLEPDIKLPLDEELQEPEEWFPIPSSFVKSIRACLFSASRSGHVPILTCIHITSGFVETCDEYRLTRYDFKDPLPGLGEDKDIKIVARNIQPLGNYSPEEYGFGEAWMHFRNKSGLTYCVRMVEGEYPDLQSYLDEGGQEIELPKELQEALAWAAIATDDAIKFEQRVKVTISKGRMLIRGEKPDGSWAEQDIRIRYTGKAIEFEAHPLFLQEMAKLAQKVLVGESSIQIDTDEFAHVISLNPDEE